MRQLAVGTRFVDGVRKLMRENLGDLIDGDIVFGRELLDDIAAQHLLELLGRNRQVPAVADPGLHLIAETGLLKLGHDGGQSALPPAATQYLAQDGWQYGALQLPKRALEGRRVLQ